MKTVFPEEQIGEYFPERIYLRGLVYFNQSRVIEFNVGKHSLSGLVDGSEREPYRVKVTWDDRFRIKSAECSCPYHYDCKHAVALLLTYVHAEENAEAGGTNRHKEKSAKPQGKREKKIVSPDELPYSFFQKEETVAEKTYLLADKTATPSFRQFLFRQRIASLPDTSGKKYLPLIYLRESKLGGWYFYPGLRSLTKGTKGKLQLYKPDKKLEVAGLEEDFLELFHALCLYAETERFRLENSYQLFREAGFPVYLWTDSRESLPIRFLPVNKVELRFRIHSMHLEKTRFYFHFHFLFHTEEGVFAKTREDQLLFLKNNNLCVLDSEKQLILYLQIEKPFINFLKGLIHHYEPLNKADIGLLQKHIKDSGWEEKLAVEFSSDKVKSLTGIVPVPILHCRRHRSYTDDNHELTFVSLYFRYREREISANVGAEFLIAEQQPGEEEIVVYKRDEQLESLAVRMLEKKLAAHQFFSPFYSDYPGDEIRLSLAFGKFLDECGWELMESGFEIRLEGEKVVKTGATVQVQITSGQDWFELQAEMRDENNQPLPFEFDLHQLLEGKVRSGDSLIYITAENLEKIKTLLNNGMDAKGRVKLFKHDFLAIQEVAGLTGVSDNEAFGQAQALAKKLMNFSHIEKVPVPQSLKATLRPYQQAGLNWLSFLHRYDLHGCLADDMGLGKTVQTIALLARLFEEKAISSVLIVVPVTTLANWEYELARFLPGVAVHRYMGTGRLKDKKALTARPIVLSSYHTVRNDIELFSGHEFDYLVLDESQNIKNYSSQIYKAVKMLKARHRLALSGTPVENNETELWALMHFLNPGLLGSLSDFKRRYVKGRDSEAFDDDRLTQLKRKIHPFILRRRKADVLKELPAKEIIVQPCEMEKEQSRLYNSTLKFYRRKLEKAFEQQGVEKSRFQVLEGLLRLRQVALYPGLLDKKYASISACKFELAKELIEELIREGHKILFFSQFIETLKLIERFLNERKYHYCYLDGSTKDRKAQIDRFQKDEKVNIFLLSLKAGGVGINLHKANYVILFDPWWNPAVEAQAIDRSHRIGQTQKVTVYKLITKESIEEKILKLQESKQKLFEELISEESSFIKSLSKKEILALFTP